MMLYIDQKKTSLIAFKELFNSFSSVRIYVTSTLEQKNSNLAFISKLLESMCCCAQLTDWNSLHCLQFWYRDCALNTCKRNELKKCNLLSLRTQMAKRIGRLKDRFFSKIRRPFHYERVHKNKDELEEPVINSSECDRTHCEAITTPTTTYSYLKTDHNHCNNNSKSPCFQKGLLAPEETEFEDLSLDENSKTAEANEEEDLVAQRKQLPPQTRRRSSAFQKLIHWVKLENRRHAICEQMEREIETRGVSLRQYRKFLATTYILYDLKMLWLTKDLTIHHTRKTWDHCVIKNTVWRKADRKRFKIQIWDTTRNCNSYI